MSVSMRLNLTFNRYFFTRGRSIKIICSSVPVVPTLLLTSIISSYLIFYFNSIFIGTTGTLEHESQSPCGESFTTGTNMEHLEQHHENMMNNQILILRFKVTITLYSMNLMCQCVRSVSYF